MSTTKKIILRGLLGMPIGLAISYIVTLIVSIIVGKGNYYPVVPDTINTFGTELNAVIIQTVLSMLYGAVWGGASVIWELENWSLLKQSATHLILVSVATFPVAFFMHWMPQNFLGVIIYYGIFLFIYASIWLGTFIKIKYQIKDINNNLN
jgi:hypothetical protein